VTLTSPALLAQPAPASKTKAAPAKKPRIVKMFMRDGLRFEPPRLVAEPGEQIVVEIENNDSTDQTHNFVLLRPGTRDAVVQAGLALAEKGPALEYVPPSADVLVHSRLLATEGSGSIAFTVPTTPGI
jgi:azurin